MILSMVAFEIRYRLHRLSTYVYFLLFFFLSFFAVSATNFGPIGTGMVLLNGPFANTLMNFQIMLFGVLVVSAIFGTSILRDFQDDTYQLIFTKPIGKPAYLGGRFVGSYLVCAAIFLSVPLGMLLGSVMPWTDQARIAPINLWWHFQPYLYFTLTQLFCLGCLFFFVAGMTRRLMIVYLQGAVLIGLYLIGGIYVQNHPDKFQTFWPSVLDPLGALLLDGVTRYWTVVEKNTRLLTWTGEFLYNRMLWMGMGLATIVSCFALFPMSVERLTVRRRKAAQQEEPDFQEGATESKSRLVAAQSFGGSTRRAQFASLFHMDFWGVAKEPAFWALVFVAFLFSVLNGMEAGEFYGTPTWPVTYLMVQAITGGTLFLYVIATIYAGELVWRRKDTRFDQIADAVPVPTWMYYAAHFAALALIEAVLLFFQILAGLALQTYLGYYKYEVGLYFKETFLVQYPLLLTFIVLALLMHTILSNKFLAHGIVVGAVILTPILYRYGFENRLYLLGEVIPYTYSDMNGYGHFAEGLFWIELYWVGFAVFQVVLTIMFLRRGTDTGWRARLREGTRRFQSSSLKALAGAGLLVMFSAGTWFFYNAHVRNEFRTAQETRDRQAEYEKKYRSLFLAPQPKITSVDVQVDLYPETRSFKASGHYVLVNREAEPIARLYLVDSRETLREVHFDRASALEMEDKRLGVFTYKFETPLAPGETMNVDFQVGHDSHGFKDGNELDAFAANGTFFDDSYFPLFGYSEQGELGDPVWRRQYGLGPVNDLPSSDDPRIRNVNLFAPYSEWITFHATVSTSPDQIAIAPGYLKREWNENGRRYFEYDMGESRINNFYSFISARYEVFREEHSGIPIEIYYTPGHDYNLKRMADSVRKGLDYFAANFGPYQFQQFRILEFPRYRTFAQSFPNTVPYSEGIGFIMRLEKPDEDIDQVFYVTAHELAHQWWGHQLLGSLSQGSNMMSESLAQYSALMIMEKEYGPQQMRKFLRYELDGYLRGRAGETNRERPLSQVQNEPYVWYQKGSVVMYALRDYIGEEKLNAILKAFLERYRFASEDLPNTGDLMVALREGTPPELQHVIEDMFETITLFDNKTTSARATAVDGKYRVELTVDTRKLRADGLGEETEIGIDDWIDVGVFSDDTKNPKPLVLEKRHIDSPHMTFEFMVDETPSRAGIDPYNKLIDRNPEDNWIPVEGL